MSTDIDKIRLYPYVHHGHIPVPGMAGGAGIAASGQPEGINGKPARKVVFSAKNPYPIFAFFEALKWDTG